MLDALSDVFKKLGLAGSNATRKHVILLSIIAGALSSDSYTLDSFMLNRLQEYKISYCFHTRRGAMTDSQCMLLLCFLFTLLSTGSG